MILARKWEVEEADNAIVSVKCCCLYSSVFYSIGYSYFIYGSWFFVYTNDITLKCSLGAGL
jgi:hypothetical protein